MSMLAAPDTITGPLTAQDLDAARQHSTGSIWQPSPHRLLMCPPCNGDCCQGRDCTANSCAPEGGRFTEPAPAMESMLRHRRVKATAGLALLLAVVGFVVRMVWPLAA